MQRQIDCAESLGEQVHFWRATGFTPASMLLEADMQQATVYYGSVPNDGLRHVRIHNLLDLVRAEGLTTEQPTYEWRDLDAALDRLVENGLAPFFELMGTPSEEIADFAEDETLHAWKRLVSDLATHLMDRYGREEVESWYFETWNEPDLGWADHDPEDVEAFCNYYDACSVGLQEANEALRFGGPGTVYNGNLFKAVLAHCADGENYFTGETGVRIDFVSVHKKGATFHEEDIGIDTEFICDRELEAVEYIRETHPELAGTPFMNNECDPQTGWLHKHTWRAGPFYPAIVCRMIDQHVERLVEDSGVDYRVLSNDNGFLGTWGHRTQLALFEGVMAAEGNLEHPHDRPRDDRFELIKKPVHNVLTALSLLGDERVAVTGDGSEAVGTLATRREDHQVAVLAYNAIDDFRDVRTDRVDLAFENLPFDEAALAHYRIDEDHGNPFAVWKEIGIPDEPSLDQLDGLAPDREQLEALRESQELELLTEPETVSTEGGTFETSFDLPRPGVSLLVLSARPDDPPGKPTDVRAKRYRGTTLGDDLLVRWEDVEARTVKTYEVLRAEEPDGPFERVNDPDLIASAYLHSPEDAVDPAGYYAVQAVDYWGRTGPRSDVIDVERTADLAR